MPLSDERKLYHDFQNGLTIILAHCEMMGAEDYKDVATRIRVIQEAATGMSNLVLKHQRTSSVQAVA